MGRKKEDANLDHKTKGKKLVKHQGKKRKNEKFKILIEEVHMPHEEYEQNMRELARLMIEFMKKRRVILREKETL